MKFVSRAIIRSLFGEPHVGWYFLEADGALGVS